MNPFSGYRKEWLSRDLLAGVSVAAVAVPTALAYSRLAGVPPVYGLYASLLPLVIYAFLGSSRELIVGPDAATCAIIAVVVAPLAGRDMDRYVSLASMLAIISGVYCVAAGLGRLGFLTNFLARPILTGYCNGIAICIITGQLGGLFGYSVGPGGFFTTLTRFYSNLGETNQASLVVGAATLGLLLLLARFAPRVPGPVVAVVGGTAVSAAFGLAERGVRILGRVPAGLPAPKLPEIRGSDWEPIALGAIGLAFISYNSAMITARGFAAKNRYDIDPNREFVALGVADIGAGILQGYPVSGGDSTSAVNDSVGGKGRVVGLVAAAALVLVLLFLTKPLAQLPISVLSAVLVVAGLGLFDLPGLARLRRVSPREFRLSLITLIGVITVGVLPGVVVAVLVAIVQLLIRASRPHDAVLGRVPGTNVYCDAAINPESETFPGLLIYRFDSSLVFFNADHFKARVRALIVGSESPVRRFLLVAESMPFMDSTGAANLEHVYRELDEKGIVPMIAKAAGATREMLDRTGLSAWLGPTRMFATVGEAVKAHSEESR